MLYFKKKDIDSFISDGKGNKIVSSYIALLLSYSVFFLLVIVAFRISYLTLTEPTLEIKWQDIGIGIGSLLTGIGLLLTGKSFDLRQANPKRDI